MDKLKKRINPTKKMVVMKDIVIPKGTVFEYREGKTDYLFGSYDAYVGTGKDTVLHVVASDDEIKHGEGNFAET